MRKRSASFTASASGNASATSGSNLTVSPNRLRPGPSFRTFKAFKSYSDRSSSSVSDSTFFISFTLCRRHLSCANQANGIAVFRVRDNQQAPLLRRANDNIAVFIKGMIRVIEINVERILEDGLRLLEGHAMLLKIAPRLFSVPLEIHAGSISS